MNNFIGLTKVLLKNSSVLRKPGDRKHNIGVIVGGAALLVLIVSSVFLYSNIYDPVAALHLDGAILAALLSSTCIAMIIFGIFYVISIYYFSDDIIHLLTLPIPPARILASKFVIVSLYQYIFEAVILLPCIVAFGVKKASISFWIYSALVLIVLPAIPTVVCSFISLLIMSFGKFFHNKDRVKLISGILAFAAAVGINVVLQTATHSISVRSLTDVAPIMEKAALLFPSNVFAINAIQNTSLLGGILQLALFLLVSAVAVVLFLLLGKAVYFSGVIGLTQSSVGRKRFAADEFGKRVHLRSAVVTLALKDWKLLYRTPAYFLNCVLSAILFPPLLAVILGFSLKEIPMPGASVMTIAIWVIACSFFSTMNSISPTAVSREGKDFAVTKYIPVSFQTQIFAKLLPGLVLSSADIIIIMLISCFFFRLGPTDFGIIFVLSLLASATFNILGLFFDIAFPKLDWDDETAAVKNNLNIILQMIAMILVLGIVTFLVNLLNLDYFAGVVFLFCAMLVLLTGSAYLLFRKGIEIFSGSRTIKTEAKKPKDLRKLITAVATVVLIGIFAVFMINENNLSAQITITSTKVEISAGFLESSSFATTQIKSISLKDSIPSTSDKVGYAMGSKLRGTFTVQGIGRGHVYTETKSGPFLYVIMKDGSFTIVNFSDGTKTQQLYEKLKTVTGLK